MSSRLKARIKRLEKKRRAEQKKANIPDKQEYIHARLCHRRHRATIVMLRVFGDDREWELSESQRRHVETPPEVVARWEDIIRRGDPFYGPSEEEKEQRTRQANEIRQKLVGRAEELQRVTVGGPE